MKKLLPLLLFALLLSGCAKTPAPALAIATPGPEQATVLRDPYRVAGEPDEVIELDAEHGYWAYRSDTLSVTADCRDYVLRGGATGNWCLAEIYWRGADAFTASVPPESGSAESVARAHGFVLFVPGAEGKLLLSDGAVCAGLDGARGQLAAAGVVEDGHWIVIAVGQTHAGDAAGLSERELAELLLAEGCETAFLLASGPDAAVVFLGLQLNTPMTETPASAPGGFGWGKTERMQEGSN